MSDDDFEAECSSGSGDTLYAWAEGNGEGSGDRIKIGVDSGEDGEPNVYLTRDEAMRLREWLLRALGTRAGGGTVVTIDKSPTLPLRADERETAIRLAHGPGEPEPPKMGSGTWWVVSAGPYALSGEVGMVILWARRRAQK